MRAACRAADGGGARCGGKRDPGELCGRLCLTQPILRAGRCSAGDDARRLAGRRRAGLDDPLDGRGDQPGPVADRGNRQGALAASPSSKTPRRSPGASLPRRSWKGARRWPLSPRRWSPKSSSRAAMPKCRSTCGAPPFRKRCGRRSGRSAGRETRSYAQLAAMAGAPPRCARRDGVRCQSGGRSVCPATAPSAATAAWRLCHASRASASCAPAKGCASGSECYCPNAGAQ